MLVLTRNARKGHDTIIATVNGVQIRIVLIGVERGKARIGVDAPDCVQIDREEVHLAKLTTKGHLAK